jgi:hypothetical protein
MSDLAATPSPIKLRWIPGLIAALLVFVVIAVYSTRVANRTDTYDDDQAAERYAKLAKQQADDAKTLTTADWVDQGKGIVRIPIDEAIPQEITALRAKPEQMGAAIPGATPAPTAPSTVPAATNAAPAASPAAAPSTNAAPTQVTPPPAAK